MTISKLHFITTHPDHAEQACQGGVDWVQLRVKDTPYDEWKALALATQQVCKKYGARLIINDNVWLAREIGADGVHLGKEDMPPEEAREILGVDYIMGGTANTMEDIQRLQRAGVDYIGVGPFRFTTTKKNLSPILGLEGYQQIMKHCQLYNIGLPLIAIGGITLADVEPLLHVGVHGLAVSAAIAGAADVSDTARQFLYRLQPITT